MLYLKNIQIILVIVQMIKNGYGLLKHDLGVVLINVSLVKMEKFLK
jgi:hypothetical protein